MSVVIVKVERRNPDKLSMFRRGAIEQILTVSTTAENYLLSSPANHIGEPIRAQFGNAAAQLSLLAADHPIKQHWRESSLGAAREFFSPALSFSLWLETRQNNASIFSRVLFFTVEVSYKISKYFSRRSLNSFCDK